MRRSVPEADDARLGRSFPGRAGFTLVELLAVLLVLGVLYGGAVLLLKSSFLGAPSPESVKREAVRVAGWLQRVFHKALLSGRGFVIYITAPLPRGRLTVEWVSPVESEVYEGGGRAYFRSNTDDSIYCFFSPKWNMLSPAFTLRVVSSPQSQSAIKYVVVSPYGRVSLHDVSP